MKNIVPEPPAIHRNDVAAVQELFARNVIPSYGRFDLVLSHGTGSYVWDVTGKRYVDLSAGIAACSLGHAHPAITRALTEQSKKLVHISNLYYHEPQGRLAEEIVSLIAPGKVFFCNSGAEANEGLYKVARKFGHAEGRFEIITAWNSFHGRTLAGIAATGQEKVKKGFEPAVPGFVHVPYNDLEAVRSAISPATVAVLIEGIQGEGGITPAQVDYLLGLRKLCDEKKLLLMMDEVQAGHFRTGSFQSYQRILEGSAAGFEPDAVSMAKSLGGGFPIGAFWVRKPYADLLGPGSHATTYGGNPLGCAVALEILKVIREEKLDQNARNTGEFLKHKLGELKSRIPDLLTDIRGLGLILGFQVNEKHPSFGKSDKPASIQLINRLHEEGLLAVPSGTNVIRLLPALNIQRTECEEGLKIISKVLETLARS
jgi:acetylornithine aminotransferase/acetylornithine/N-succinyldiaminopimelate aminotransferase